MHKKAQNGSSGRSVQPTRTVEFMQLLRWQQWEQSQRGKCAGDNPREPCCNPLGCATEPGDSETVLETWRGAVSAALNPRTHWLSEALIWSAASSQSNKDKNRTPSTRSQSVTVLLTLYAFSIRLTLFSFRMTAKFMGFLLIRPGFLLKSTCWKIFETNAEVRNTELWF